MGTTLAALHALVQRKLICPAHCPRAQGLSYPWEAHGDPYAEDFKTTSLFKQRALEAKAAESTSEDAH